MRNAKIEIVWDGEKGKLRALAINVGGWVRFPKALRVEGAIYNVTDLRVGKSGSWMACGSITRVNGQRAAA